MVTAKSAELAIRSIGLGYDIAADLRLKYCKRDLSDPCLIEIDDGEGRDVVLPGGVCIPNVSTSIKCDKGERMRFTSDVLSFQQVLCALLLAFAVSFCSLSGSGIEFRLKVFSKV